MASTPPLDVNLVVRCVGPVIEAKFGQLPFVIAGSYPSAVKAYEYDHNWTIAYNDIDVYVWTRPDANRTEIEDGFNIDHEYRDVETQSQTNTRSPSDIVDVSYSTIDVGGTSVVFNFIEKIGTFSLGGLVDTFDINAIKVGFSVHWSSDEDCVNDEPTIPRIMHWDDARPEFRQFRRSKVLGIPDIEALARPLSSFIRLLYKAQQLRLDYTLPLDNILIPTLDGRCIGKPTYLKLQRLEPSYMAEVTSRFCFGSPFWWVRFQVRLWRFARRILRIMSNHEYEEIEAYSSWLFSSGIELHAY